MFPQRRHGDVNMIGHDHKIIEGDTWVAATPPVAEGESDASSPRCYVARRRHRGHIAVAQNIFHNFPQFRPRQDTFPMTFIQPLFPSIGEKLVIFLLSFTIPWLRIFLTRLLARRTRHPPLLGH